MFSIFSSMASTMASNLLLAFLLLAHSISGSIRSHAAQRLDWRLSNFFNFENSDLKLLIEAWIALITASKLHEISLSQKY